MRVGLGRLPAGGRRSEVHGRDVDPEAATQDGQVKNAGARGFGAANVFTGNGCLAHLPRADIHRGRRGGGVVAATTATQGREDAGPPPGLETFGRVTSIEVDTGAGGVGRAEGEAISARPQARPRFVLSRKYDETVTSERR
jgi:hypothetical protein